MKKFFFLALLILAVDCGLAQTSPDEHEWMATIKVVDENDLPVAKASVKVGYYIKNTSVEIKGTTDTNGIFTARRATSTLNYVEYKLALEVEKEGYYGTRSTCDLGLPYDVVKWNPTITLPLKKVGKPIAMYAKSTTYIVFPAFNQPVGYDLTAGDWVAPYGNGANTDFIFTENHLDSKSGYTFTISFPNPGDGIQGFAMSESEKGSGFHSQHEAPVDGYEPKYEQTHMHDANRVYYFRVRTVLDHQGNVTSAYYGKIYGDFMQFTYYLNPTPNDRNIEFDPKQNLLGGLKSFERVSTP
jgi:hypothetical protein